MYSGYRGFYGLLVYIYCGFEVCVQRIEPRKGLKIRFLFSWIKFYCIWKEECSFLFPVLYNFCLSHAFQFSFKIIVWLIGWLVSWFDNPYLWEDASTAHSSYFISVVQENKTSFSGPIEFKYFNWAKPHQKFFPYRRSDTISNSNAHFMNSVLFFLWTDKKRHFVAEKSGSRYLKLILYFLTEQF